MSKKQEKIEGGGHDWVYFAYGGRINTDGRDTVKVCFNCSVIYSPAIDAKPCEGI